MSKQKYLVSIVGATAIGKTALSIKVAQHFNCPIISSDSRQFYKEMTIGTAVPNQLELNSAKHYFIQNRSIHYGQYIKTDLSGVAERWRPSILSLFALTLQPDPGCLTFRYYI